MNHLLPRVLLLNSLPSLYIGLLVVGAIATPVMAERPDSGQDLQEDEIQLSLQESPQTLSVSAIESLGDLKYKEFQTPVENSITPVTSLQRLSSEPLSNRPSFQERNSLEDSTLPETEVTLNQNPKTETQAITPVSELAQADLTDNPSQQPFLSVDDLLEATETESMGQVTNVSQLRDVQPSDWAYEALRSLVERYGCIAGYPDGSFRGNRAMTRYEFAAGLNACMQQIERLIPNQGELVNQDYLTTVQPLLNEFSTELTVLETRVDSLEGRTAFLEDHQFSTTTKLFGQVVMGVQGRTENEAVFFAGSKVRDDQTNINLITNTQLSLFTQFSPRSLLLTGLQSGSGSTGGINPTFTRLGYEGATVPNNNVVLSDLTYRQLFGRNFAFIVGTNGVNGVNVFRGANRVESVGFGPISAFAQRNPVISIGGGGAGVGFDWQVNPRISLQGVYFTDLAENPSLGGIFGGDRGRTTAGVQLAITPINRLDIALNYINSYAPGGRSDSGRLGTGIGDDLLTVNAPLKTDAFGGTVSFRVTRGLTIGGWAGYTDSSIPGRSGNVETVNWMAFLNFPDLFGRGNLGGIYVGQPPRISSSDLPGSSGSSFGFNIPDLISGTGNGDPGDQPGTATHVEAFYRLRVTDNITITPGVVVVFDQGHNPDSDTVAIGAIRTTFRF